MAKDSLERASSSSVIGFRAPGYTINKSDVRMLEAIREAGYLYDSSIISGSRNQYQIMDNLLEVPPTSLKVLNYYIPANGGFFFRIMPYKVFRAFIRKFNSNGIPLNFYVHSWEIFTDYPRMPLPFHKKFIQYFNLKSVDTKLKNLLKDFCFVSIKSHFNLKK